MRIITVTCAECHGLDPNCPECQGQGKMQIVAREVRMGWMEYVLGAAWIAALAAFCWAMWRMWEWL